MKILIVGAGVIGSIYGYLLSQSGNDLTHYVRSGKKQNFVNGLPIRLLDGRKKNPRDEDVVYHLNVTEEFNENAPYDLIIVSVRHYQLKSVLPLLKENAGDTDILFFNGIWGGLEQVDAYLPRSQYLWGFPVAGGGFCDGRLDAAVLDEIRLGEMNGQITPRLERISQLFTQAGLKVDSRPNIQHWLWVHFAINCGIIGASFKAGGAKELLNSISNLRLGILAGREALGVCEALGVDTHSFEDARSFYMAAIPGAVAVWWMMKTNAPARKIMERHSAVDELQIMYYDLLQSARQLNISMRVYESFKPFVDHPKIKI